MFTKMQRKGNPLALLVGMQTGAVTLEHSMEVCQKLKIAPAVALLGIYLKKTKTLIQNDTRILFIAALSAMANYGNSSNVHQLMNG